MCFDGQDCRSSQTEERQLDQNKQSQIFYLLDKYQLYLIMTYFSLTHKYILTHSLTHSHLLHKLSWFTVYQQQIFKKYSHHRTSSSSASSLAIADLVHSKNIGDTFFFRPAAISTDFRICSARKADSSSVYKMERVRSLQYKENQMCPIRKCINK